MKKLFALVLTLALVFAIAAPAMAATWGAPTAPTGTPYATSVTLLQKSTDASGATYYTAYPANLGVVAGTTVFFQVTFTIPSAADVAAYYGTVDGTAGVVKSTVTLKNLKNVEEVLGSDASSISTVASNKIAIDLSAAAEEETHSVIYTAVVDKTAEASITSLYGYGVGTTVASFTNIVKGDYTINATGITKGSSTLTLGLTSAKLVNGMTLTTGGVTYTVSAGPVFQYIDNSTIKTLATTDANYAAVLAVYNDLTGVLGFKAGDAGIYFTAANILANFGYNNAATATGTYKPYTSSLTVSDSTTVPNTGDAVSVLGFVMVGLALLATAAVVVKKVRA